MFDHILARLGIAGTIKKADSPETAGANRIVTTDHTGKISPTLVSAGTVDELGADHVTYVVGNLPNTANLQTLLVAMDNLYLHKDGKLTEIAVGNVVESFSNVKQPAQAATVAGDWSKAGVVFKAAYDTAVDTLTTTEGKVVPYAVTPAVANTRYLLKNSGTSGTPANPGPQVAYGYFEYTSALSAALGTDANDHTLVSREYVTSALAAGLGVTTTGTVWVSPTGTNTSDTDIFQFNAPYGSLKTALTKIGAFRANNANTAWRTKLITVIVMPGTYVLASTDSNFGSDAYSDYLRIHFMPGAKMAYSENSNFSSPMFNLATVTNFSVTGYGEFSTTNATEAVGCAVISCDTAVATVSANIAFECQSITTASQAIYLHHYTSGTPDAALNINIKVHGDITSTTSKTDWGAITLGGRVNSNIAIGGNVISSAQGISVGISTAGTVLGGIDKSSHIIRVNSISCAGTAIVFGNASSDTSSDNGQDISTVIYANLIKTTSAVPTISTTVSSPGGRLHITAERIYSKLSYCALINDGVITINNAILTAAAATYCVYITSTPTLTLKGLQLSSGHSGTSIEASSSNTVRLIGTTRSNKAIGTNIVLSGGAFDAGLAI